MAPAPSLTELIQTVNDRSADGDALTRVAAAAEVSGEITSKADLLLGHFVEAARHAGRSWAEIGAALGVTKQGAQQRFVDRDVSTPAADEHLLVRYTGRARASVARAREEALEMGHNYVGTEHLLLGVLVDPAAISVRVLAAMRVSRRMPYALPHGSGAVGITPRSSSWTAVATRKPASERNVPDENYVHKQPSSPVPTRSARKSAAPN